MNEIITIDGVKYKRIEENPQPKYAVGDWVKIVANKLPRLDCDSRIGEVAKIDRVYDYGYYKRNGEPIQAYGIGEMWVVYEDELEPAEEPKQDPFDIKDGDKYFYIMSDGWLDYIHHIGAVSDIRRKKVANACKDEELMAQRAMHETLNRLLWRASVQAGELDNPWDEHIRHYYIYYNKNLDTLKIDFNYLCQIQGICYFPSKESAQAAIDNIVKPFMKEHSDFVW